MYSDDEKDIVENIGDVSQDDAISWDSIIDTDEDGIVSIKDGSTAIPSPSDIATEVFTNDSNSSDADVLKEIVDDIDVDLDEIKKIPKKYFTLKADEEKNVQIGTSAQALKRYYPALVSGDEDKEMLAVAYDRLGVIALAAIDKLHEENKKLKEENDNIKERLRKIEEKLGL